MTEHTADSGNTFVGINTSTGIVGPTNLFDGTTAPSGEVSSGDTITLEFSKPLTFNRVEVLWNSPPSSFLGVNVESSLNDVVYYSVLNIPSGIAGASPSLVKSSAEYDINAPVDPSVNVDMDGFAAKFVRLTFDGTDGLTRDVRQIKLYGAHSTKGFILTSGWDSTLENLSRENFGRSVGSLPSGWRNNGDWDWFVDEDVHQSGFFIDDIVGSGDRTAARTQRSSPPGSSGILEVDVNVTSARDFSFAYKWDMQGGSSLFDKSDPKDDYLFLQVQTTGVLLDFTDTMLAPPTTSPQDYRKHTIRLENLGLNTIRWIYRRGNKTAGAGPSLAEATVWIDNVDGLDPQPGSPNRLTTLWGYVSAAPELKADSRYSYIEGMVDPSESINAYINPFSGQPTGVLNAYHISEVAITGASYGYIAALREFGDAYGYTEGFIDSISENVNGYIFTSGAFESFFGHMQAKLNDSINGFLLAPSGAFNQINAYIATPQFLAVNGYVKVTENEQIQINAYFKADGFGDHFHGYMFGSGLTHQSYGYINAEGIVGRTNAYMRSTQNTNVASYIEGHQAISGVINAWISGIATISDSLNGYIPAISGDISENINGFIGGLELPDGRINAHIIGFGGSGECSFPTPSVPFVSSPTGNFFN